MSAISKDLSVPKAMELIKTSQADSSSLSDLDQVWSLVAGGKIGSGLMKTNLKGSKKKPGYSGLDGARNLLNDMIYESLSKYDAEIAKCTDFYSKQCALMEIARGAIAAANFMAASSRALILDAQGNINKCEVAIPETKMELTQHLRKCKNEIHKLNSRLKIVMGDIAIMTMILKMTDCDSKFVQMKKMVMLRCKDNCTKKSYVSFNHHALQQKVAQLKSPISLGLMQDSFNDMFDDNAPIASVKLMQVDNEGYQEPEMEGEMEEMEGGGEMME